MGFCCDGFFGAFDCCCGVLEALGLGGAGVALVPPSACFTTGSAIKGSVRALTIAFSSRTMSSRSNEGSAPPEKLESPHAIGSFPKVFMW